MDATAADRWAGLIGHGRFREAAEANARGVLAQAAGLSPHFTWLTNNFARAATLIGIVFLHARDGHVSVADLLARNRSKGTASDGRVLQLLDRARAAGLVAIAPETGPWRGRRITPLPLLVDQLRERAAIEIAAAALVVPSAAACLPRLADPACLLAFLAAMGRFDTGPQRRGPGTLIFLAHDAGLMCLYALMVSQPPDRQRLLERAALSRTALAARFGVSRPHVTRLFAQAERAGFLSLAHRGEVVFTPAMSADLERHFALTFHAIAASAIAASS